jgi:hypothetical protein
MREPRVRQPREPVGVVALVGWALVLALAAGLAGAGVGWARRASGRAGPDLAKALAAARERAGGELRRAVDALYSEDAARGEQALSALEAADPSNSYTAFLRIALCQSRKSEPGVPDLLAAASGGEWDLYVDAVGVPDRVTQDRELTVIRRTTESLCLAATAGALGDGRAALARLRAMGLRLAGAHPRDVVHAQAGADMRRRASDEMVVLARQRAVREEVREEVREAESVRAADTKWQESVDRAAVRFVSKQTHRTALTESGARAAIAGEASVVADLLSAAPP